MPIHGTAPSKWSWADLQETGPEAESRAEELERQRRDVQSAYQRGLDEGEQKGVSTARAELSVALKAIMSSLDDVRANREAWSERLEEHLVVLAAAMAHKVIERTREEDDTVFVELAKAAVAAFPMDEPIRIRLHPADQAVLIEGGFLDEVIVGRSVRWVPDDEVVPGGCVVEGPDRIVDGRVDEALARVVRVLTHG